MGGLGSGFLTQLQSDGEYPWNKEGLKQLKAGQP